MNNLFTAKLLQNLNNKKSEKGFTLIELLVVVIIIGVLAAVALPNLLGQVGKARESEAKTALGALNRSQQAYRMETNEFYSDGGTFGDTQTALGVIPGNEFYTWANDTAANQGVDALFTADGTDPANDGTRDFASGVNYAGGNFITTLCVATNKDAAGGTAAVNAVAGGGCDGGGSQIK